MTPYSVLMWAAMPASRSSCVAPAYCVHSLPASPSRDGAKRVVVACGGGVVGFGVEEVVRVCGDIDPGDVGAGARPHRS